jgi:2-dehydro-3-deoxygalactonokinase
MTRWAEGFIAVDWGTTNRRAYLLDEHGNFADEFEDDKGILKVERGDFASAVTQISERLGDKPMLLAGMIGSNRGWIEAPYVPCPAGFSELADNLAWAEDGKIAIVPGVCVADGDADVMRGEEVQLVGAVARAEIPGDCVVCHPGTHNKWVVVDYGRIAQFRTVLTGELFSMLKEKSILSDLLAGEAKADDAFAEGARRGLSGNGITADLFGARARALLGQLDRADGASYVSGLLIGEDVRFGLSKFAPSKVYVLGRPELTALYSAALDIAGIESRQSDGEQAFVAGAAKIIEAIE